MQHNKQRARQLTRIRRHLERAESLTDRAVDSYNRGMHQSARWDFDKAHDHLIAAAQIRRYGKTAGVEV